MKTTEINPLYTPNDPSSPDVWAMMQKRAEAGEILAFALTVVRRNDDDPSMGPIIVTTHGAYNEAVWKECPITYGRIASPPAAAPSAADAGAVSPFPT